MTIEDVIREYMKNNNGEIPSLVVITYDHSIILPFEDYKEAKNKADEIGGMVLVIGWTTHAIIYNSKDPK